jgi:transcriptional regulator with XRE-family HTH domain
MSTFSDNLKLLRTKIDLTQAEIAEKVGVSSSNWSNYEVGRSEPSIEVVVKIASILRVSVETLVSQDLTLIVDNLIKGNLIDKGKDQKNSQKGNEIGNPLGNLNEDSPPYGNTETLIATLKNLVQSKEDIILLLKARNKQLEQLNVSSQQGHT